MDNLWEIFRPERTKSVLALVLAVVQVVAIFYLPSLGLSEVLQTLPSDQLAMVLVVNLLWDTLAYYLFFCGLFVLSAARRRPFSSHFRVLALSLVLIFNPVTLYLISQSLRSGMVVPAENQQGADCGAEVVSFADFSKAERAGLKIGDVVTSIDGKPVSGANDVLEYLKSKRSGDAVSVQTERGAFPVELVSEPEKGGPVLGVKFQDRVCPSADTAAPLPSPASSALVYTNTDYGFEFTLPESWRGYAIVEEEWEGYHQGEQGQLPAARGPLLSIRHPQWTAESPRQDIPIMVFTLDQWSELENGILHVGAAPINPSELGRNGRYVFALPARYNYAFPAGYEEVEQILQDSPLRAF